jgi:negative regulator of genetic competence, sporulation and motility
MKFLHFIVVATVFAITSCTIDKTDYESELSTETTEYIDFEEVTSIVNGDYIISIEALNGTFYKGYNEIHLKIINTQTNENLENTEVTFLPIMTDANGNKSSCPHGYNLEYDTTEAYYLGYSVFTSESDTTVSWQLYLDFMDSTDTYTAEQTVTVEEQTNLNLNMTAFTGNDDEQYFIALVSPQSPSVAENDLIAGIYKYNQPTTTAGTFPDATQFSYDIVDNYTLLLDPRMPEPSMGNHSSPNNEDLVQESDGLYHGVVNYTMTGNWTLNFIFQDENETTIKGTEVSTEFTPGVEGERSELYIDILF